MFSFFFKSTPLLEAKPSRFDSIPEFNKISLLLSKLRTKRDQLKLIVEPILKKRTSGEKSPLTLAEIKHSIISDFLKVTHAKIQAFNNQTISPNMNDTVRQKYSLCHDIFILLNDALNKNKKNLETLRGSGKIAAVSASYVATLIGVGSLAATTFSGMGVFVATLVAGRVFEMGYSLSGVQVERPESLQIIYDLLDELNTILRDLNHFQNHYQLLNLNPLEASIHEIKISYKQLALQYHPDKHAGVNATEMAELNRKFAAISTAYEILSDPEKKETYDRLYKKYILNQSPALISNDTPRLALTYK